MDLRMLFKLLEAENPMRDSQSIGFLVTPDGFLEHFLADLNRRGIPKGLEF
jgi:hypothetical protein